VRLSAFKVRVTPELLVIAASKVFSQLPIPRQLRNRLRLFATAGVAAVAVMVQTSKNIELFNPMIFQKHCR
jgi:hypothetical protein